MTHQETRKLVLGDSWIIRDSWCIVVGSVVPQVNLFSPTIMDKSLGTLFAFLGCFPIHTCPPLTPQTTLDACVQNFFESKFQLCIGWGEGELQEKF